MVNILFKFLYIHMDKISLQISQKFKQLIFLSFYSSYLFDIASNTINVVSIKETSSFKVK